MRRLSSLVSSSVSQASSRRALWSLALLLATLAPPGLTAQDSGKLVAEWWEAAYLQGSRAGYVRTRIDEIEQDGLLALRSMVELRLNVKRNNDTVQLAMESGTYELADGRVLGTFMKQAVGRGKTLEITGAVDGRQLTLTLDKTKLLKPAPWDPRTLGIIKQKLLFKDRAVKPGDAFDYQAFEPTINLVVTYRVNVRDEEEVELFAGKHKKRLLRVEAKADKIGTFQLPPYVVWLDESLLPMRGEFEVPGLGKVTTYSASKALAFAPGSSAPSLDVGISHYVRLQRKIPRPHESLAAVYRISLKEKASEELAEAFVRDNRQDVKIVDERTLTLHVSARNKGIPGPQPGSEFSQSSYFITSGSQKVQELARQAVGGEKDPWKKALKVEKWVHEHMRVRHDEALAPAEQVARTLAGDCTEFAMLTAAMCRAEGIPSRTAMGLVYADVRVGPVFAFHMWTEVWVDGNWQPLDATLGRGGIGAAHLKISDQSWHEEQSMTPLLPILRVLGKLSIDVVRVEHP